MEREPSWRDIRGLRSDPPGRAVEDPDRRRVFSAALQQAEELHRASAASGFAGRPLPLFYSLSQGGRAIAAVRVASENWVYHGHGLRTPPEEGAEEVLEAQVAPNKTGAFPLLAEATGSAPLEGNVGLGALLASLPELSGLLAPHTDATAALPLSPDYAWPISRRLYVSNWQAPRTGVYTGPEGKLPADRRQAAMEEKLAPYGRARNWKIGPNQIYQDGRVGIGLHWPLEGGSEDAYKPLEAVATRSGDFYYLRPGLGADGEELSILMTWWAALFALSALARYEPSLWSAALDVDASTVAVVLEEVLEVGQRRVPELLHEALVEEERLRRTVFETETPSA